MTQTLVPAEENYTFYDVDGVAKSISREAIDQLLSQIYTPGQVQRTFDSRPETDDEDRARDDPAVRPKTTLPLNGDSNEVVADLGSYTGVLPREEAKQLRMQDETRHSRRDDTRRTQRGGSPMRIEDLSVCMQELMALQARVIAQQKNQQHLLQREKKETKREKLD